jgi:hypothetical protein
MALGAYIRGWRGWLVAGAVALFLAVIVFWPDTITKTSASRLQHGMTKNEVQAILGAPYRSVGPHGDEWWIGYEGCLIVHYDEHGKLAWRNWEDLPRRTRFPESFLHPILWPID